MNFTFVLPTVQEIKQRMTGSVCFRLKEDWFHFPKKVLKKRSRGIFSRSWDPVDLGYFDHADYEFGGSQARGGGGTLVLFVVRGHAIFWGYFFQTITELWVSFSQFFDISRNYGCPFQGIFHNFRNYGPDIYSICGIMALKIHQNLRNYGYQFFGQNGTSPSHNRLSYPPPPRDPNRYSLI